MKQGLIQTLKTLKGNPRACVYTEPLWGVSMNLCLPYASVYMVTLGLQDSEIGFVASIFMLSQVVFAFLSGPVTDKLGRRKATAIFDFVGWCIPCVLWWRADAFPFFVVAALFNGVNQITTNSWDCLLIEDAEKEKVTAIQSLVVVCGQLSVLFAPIAAILFSRISVVPAIRILYINAFVIMILKLVLLYIFSRETKVGKIRMKESRGKNVFELAAGYGGVLKIIRKSPGTIFALCITSIVGISILLNNTFWVVFVSQKLLVPARFLPYFPVMRSLVAIAFFFFVVPRLTGTKFKHPLLIGFACHFIGQIVLILTPQSGALKYIVLCTSTLIDSFAAAYLFMLAKSLVFLHVNPIERARVQAIINMITMAAVAPFGWIGGLLSDVSRALPFVLNLFVLIAGVIITIIFCRKKGIDDG